MTKVNDVVDHSNFIEFSALELSGNSRPMVTAADIELLNRADPGLQIYVFDAFILYTHVRYMAPAVCQTGGYPAHVMSEIMARQGFVYSAGREANPQAMFSETLTFIAPRRVLLDEEWYTAYPVLTSLLSPTPGSILARSELKAHAVCHGDGRFVVQDIVVSVIPVPIEGMEPAEPHAFSYHEYEWRTRFEQGQELGPDLQCFSNIGPNQPAIQDALAVYCDMTPPGMPIAVEFVLDACGPA